jgi:nitroimidazol reductase NimA-like FMN-containing flavoprotein (pyridoxamine 5'-phosphate oxidase superfamily)
VPSRAVIDIDQFLARPLVARVAAAGPTVRPVWFVWEDGCLWWPVGTWSKLEQILDSDPHVAVVIDTCDLAAGKVLQVKMRESVAIEAADPARMHRLFTKYLGADRTSWDPRFDPHEAGLKMVRLRPERVTARDLSYSPAT